MAEVRKWLTGGYGPIPEDITLYLKSSEFDSQVLAALTDRALVVRAKTLLSEANRVIRELMVGHPTETRLINSLLTRCSSLSDMLQNLETEGGAGAKT